MKKILLTCLGIGCFMVCVAAGRSYVDHYEWSQQASRVVRKVNLKIPTQFKEAVHGAGSTLYLKTQRNRTAMQAVLFHIH